MFIIPVVVVILAAIFAYILYWISYPFLLRFLIENNIDATTPSNLTNGANGNNGVNGNSSPQTRNGSNGIPGANTPGGAAGAAGAAGAQGLEGAPGIDGPPGEDGEDGDNGVPGIDPIFIRENIFDPNSKRVFYVNGVPINTHIQTVEQKKQAAFDKDVNRIKERIQTSFKTQADKTFFTNLADTLVRGTVPDPDPLVLDTTLKFNTFLDLLNVEYKNARDVLSSTKNAQTTIIDTAQASLTALRSQRLIDDNTRQQISFTNDIREEVLNAIASPSTRFTDLRNDILVAGTQTIDGAIAVLTSERTAALNAFEAATTPAVRTAQAQIVSERTAEINLFKGAKDSINGEKEIVKNDIFNAFKNGLDLSGNTYYGNVGIFGNYSPDGSTALNSQISNARSAISAAVLLCGTTLDAFISPYKLANP